MLWSKDANAISLIRASENNISASRAQAQMSVASNSINNNILTFENCLVDQIPEAENIQQSSIPAITKIITNLK